MVVLKNSLFLHGVLYTVLDLVRGLLRLEVYQTAGVLPVFEDMNDGVRRPLALIAGVVSAGAARPAVSAKAGGAVNGGAPFILTVDWLDWLC